MYRIFFKRLFDLFFSLLLFILSSPVFGVLILFLSLYYKGSPFFFQKRPGYRTKVFQVIKFKSMKDAFDESGNPLPDEMRITTVGRLLRKTSLDELPQLINVIKGDMSFIGPRPLLMQYLPYYSERELQRHQVRPGITGLAQVSGRNYLNWNDRLELDVHYMENISLRLDSYILFKTIYKVLKGSDINIIPNGKPFDAFRRQQREAMEKKTAQIA
ncbi:MAG TPA: sugar transferase [Sphingobacteriaceae bacterium]